MEAAEIREQLHKYVDKSDEKLLRLLFALAQQYDENESDFEFADNDIKLFDECREKRLRGESKT